MVTVERCILWGLFDVNLIYSYLKSVLLMSIYVMQPSSAKNTSTPDVIYVYAGILRLPLFLSMDGCSSVKNIQKCVEHISIAYILRLFS